MLDGAEEQKFPHTNVQVSQQGILISITLAPGFTINTVLGEELANDICKLWVQTRKNIADQMRVIEHVKASKIN